MSFKSLKYEPASPEAMKRWFLPLVVSLFIMLAGMAWTWRVGQESNALEHHLTHVKEAVDDLRAYVTLKETAQR